MCPGCWSPCHAVPGAFIERSALPHFGTSEPAPISHFSSSSSASCLAANCLTSTPKTSEKLSLSAPDCLLYSSPARVLGDAVGELVADHVERVRERALVEELAAAVAVDHLRAVPERVVVARAVVDRGDELEAVAVDAVAVIDVAVEVVRRAGAVVGLVDRDVVGRRVALGAGELARQRRAAAVLGVIDGALAGGRGRQEAEARDIDVERAHEACRRAGAWPAARPRPRSCEGPHRAPRGLPPR